jgi:hypothetical protein
LDQLIIVQFSQDNRNSVFKIVLEIHVYMLVEFVIIMLIVEMLQLQI